jgi:uncharacterized protein (TIGR02099 family)
VIHHHIKRATRHLIFWSVCSVALSLLTVRILLAVIDNYKADMLAEISKQIEAPVTIGHLRTHINGVKAQLVLEDIVISASQNSKAPPPIKLKEMRLGINLMDLLLNRDVLSSSWVTLVGAKLTVKRQTDGSIAVVGLKAGEGQPLWLLQGHKYQVLQSSVTWQDEQKNGKSLTFDDVNIMIHNEGDRHRVNVMMELPKKQGEILRVALDVKGNIFEPLAIEGLGFIEGKAINLPEWVTVDLPLGLNIKSGVSDFKIWGQWQHSKLTSITGDIQAKTVLMTQPHKRDFSNPHFSALFFWNNDDQEWRLDVERFLLETATKKYPATTFSVSSNHTDYQQLHNIKLSSQQIDVQEFANIAEFFAPLTDEQGKLLTQAQATGQLENVSLSADFDNKQFAINANFNRLSIDPVSTSIGVDNLTGTIHGNEQQGSVQFDTKNAHLNYPHLFRSILPINKLQGTIHWQQNIDDWTVNSPLLEVNSPDIQSKTRLHLVIPKSDKPVFMDLQTAFSSDDMSKSVTYYPTSMMNKNTVTWLDQAFIGGKVPKGGVLVYGNLNEFPFMDGQGMFEVLFEAKQLELNYHPDWPHLTDLEGEVLFTQDHLQVNLTGKSDKISIKQADIRIPSLNKGDRVLVDGEFTASAMDTLNFLQKTPLILPIAKVLESITPQGNTEVHTELTIPLIEGVAVKVDGAAKFNDARLTVNSLDLPIDKLTGALKFNEKGIFSDPIHATALGYPLQIGIKNNDQQTTINVAGHTDIDHLSKQFPLSGWAMAKGDTDYKLALQLPYDNSPVELSVQSKLEGIHIDLPNGLGKTAAQQRDLSLIFSLTDKPLLPIHLNYDNKVKAALNFDIKKRHVDAGHILIGTGEVSSTLNSGIKLEINNEQLALQDWLSLGASMAQNNSDTNTDTTAINEIKLHSGSGLWKKTPLGLVDLSLKPDGKQWAGTLNSQFAKGKLNIPFNLKGENRITLAMDELDLSLIKKLNTEETSQTPSITPESIPLITITSNKTRWQGIELGQLNLVSERISNGIHFKNISLNSDIQKLSLTGDWQVNGTQSNTRAKGRLEMMRADELFKRLDISKDFSKTSGYIDFNVHWQGAPQQFSLANLQGTLDTELNSGRILSIEPGFGRILGVLAVAQWIKRLQLDFGDIYEEGLTFNSITGHFDLAQGKAHTDNLIVDSVPAKITLTGDTDFLHRTVNHTIMVAPKSADAVPIAGTIMGKVASFIGKSLTGKDQDGFFFGSQYLVTGEWGKVQVIPHHENDGLLQKTWNGLTDFSWLNQQKDQ